MRSGVHPSAEPYPGGGWLCTVPFLPPSLNDLASEHWGVRKSRQEQMDRWWRVLAYRHRIQPFETVRLSLRIWFPSGRMRDPFNYVGKQLVDGAVHAGLVRDDQRHMRADEPILGYDKDRPRTEVLLRPWDGTRPMDQWGWPV